MPYLKKAQRENVHKQGFAWDGAELNYLITYHINKFLTNRAVTQPLRYADFAEALSALEGAKREFQRCVMDPYEAAKSAENGPVYAPPVIPEPEEPYEPSG